MLRVNKVSEYGVLALGYVGGCSRDVSAREIAEGLNLPYEITAKTLQRLKEAGFVSSTKGAHGGYRLKNPLSEISFAQVISAIEGPMALIDCMTDQEKPACSRSGQCEIKSGLRVLNDKIRNILESTKLDELIDRKTPQ